jgi:hypothetical protein
LPAASNIGYFAAVDAPACVYGFVGTPGPGAYGEPPPGIGFRFPAASNIGTRVGFPRFIGDAFGISDGWFGTSGVLNWVAPPGTCGRAGTPGPGEYVWVIGVGFPAASNIGRGMDEGLPAASNIGTRGEVDVAGEYPAVATRSAHDIAGIGPAPTDTFGTPAFGPNIG